MAQKNTSRLPLHVPHPFLIIMFGVNLLMLVMAGCNEYHHTERWHNDLKGDRHSSLSFMAESSYTRTFADAMKDSAVFVGSTLSTLFLCTGSCFLAALGSLVTANWVSLRYWSLWFGVSWLSGFLFLFLLANLTTYRG